MTNEGLVIRIPSDFKDDFLSVLQPEEKKAHIRIQRVRSYRAAELLFADILLTLLSAGSLAALAKIIKSWLERKRGVIEVINQKTGVKIKFQGPLDRFPLEELQEILEEPSRSKS